MKNFILIACFVLVGAACNSDNSKVIEEVFEARKVAFVQLAQGDQFGVSAQKEFRVISKQSEWNDLINDSSTFFRASISDPVNLTIDFSIFEVLLVLDKEYPYGGQSIDVVDIVEYQDKLLVSVDRLLGANDAPVLSRPFHIVKIPKTGKPVIFDEL